VRLTFNPQWEDLWILSEDFVVPSVPLGSKYICLVAFVHLYSSVPALTYNFQTPPLDLATCGLPLITPKNQDGTDLHGLDMLRGF
jgi:hypothetical protein